MRKIINLNKDWLFSKDASDISLIPEGTLVNLPHTWNAEDGHDGVNDYFRGSCIYTKTLLKEDLPEADRYYLQINAANSSSDIYANGEKLCHHDGGYSIFRVELTDALKNGKANINIVVDNSANETVYPQMADFTFYGGLYRGVELIAVNNTHFDLDYYGGSGIKITPVIDGKDADVEIEVFTTELSDGDEISYSILDKEGNEILSAKSADKKANFKIENVHLWHGRRDPYLYSAKASIVRGGEVIDEVSARFGCRSFKIDPENGFILNGEEYPLRGVSRHQDRLGIGNALLPEHHKEDIGYIMELGATTIRLAHYQHDQYFYDLCDECGLVIWAEIPYISRHMATGRENTISQMKPNKPRIPFAAYCPVDSCFVTL